MIYELIKKRDPFAFVRYCDGELALIEGKPIGPGTQATDIDNWTAPNYITELGEALREGLKCEDPNYYYGIPQHEPMYSKYRKFIANTNILDTDIFINDNWDKFCEFDWGEYILVANENGDIESPSDCVNTWKTLLHRLVPYLDHTNTLFLFSAGPMSCVAIDWMWRQNPNNMYVDVGSAIDYKTKNRVTRPFMRKWDKIINGNNNSNS